VRVAKEWNSFTPDDKILGADNRSAIYMMGAAEYFGTKDKPAKIDVVIQRKLQSWDIRPKEPGVVSNIVKLVKSWNNGN